MRQLILVRHAKSEWPPNVHDLEREISVRGLQDCAIAADYFQNLSNLETFKVHVSIAKRTQITWSQIASKLSVQPKVIYSEAIYEASLGDLIQYLAEQNDSNLIFVGHNPGLARLGNYLTGDAVVKFPTLSIWHIATDGDWAPLNARTISRHVPRADEGNPDFD